MKKRYLIAVAILLVFCLLMFLVTHFSPSTVLSTEGYFVSGEEVEDILLTDKKIAKTKNVKLEKVSYEDSFYNNMDKLYVGEEDKRLVNDNYPIFSNEGVAVFNINEKSKLVNNKFEYLEGYENFTLTGGKLYNYGDLEQADFEDYIFLQLPNGAYVNLYPIKILSNNLEYEIPVNSIIAFYEGYAKFFVYDNSGKLIYNIEDGIDLYSEITMGETKFTYKKLLIFVGKIEDTSNGGSSDSDLELDEEEEASDSKPSTPEVKYVKPTVKVNNFTTKVYSASSRLSISDPSGVISGGITFQFKIGDKIYLRKTFASSGDIQITGLVPNTKFQIIGSFKYYNEESKKMEMTFFEQTVSTAGLDGLGSVDLAFENGPVYSDKVEIRNIRITSDLKSEAIYGISKGMIVIDGEEFSLPSAFVRELVAGRSITYISPASIESCSVLNYEIRLLDAYGNVIKTNNNRGQTRTSKVAPTVVAKQTDGSVTSINFNISLKNPDNVNIGNYRYVIYDRNMSIVSSQKLDTLNSQQIVLEDLDPNSTYSIKVLGDFDIEDGKGIVKDSVLGEGKFTTLPLSSLGYLRVKTGTKELTSSHAILDTYVDTDTTSAILLTLINKYKVSVLDGETVIYTKTYEGEELASLLTGEHFYDRIDNLVSGTEYSIVFESTAKQGTVEEVVPVLYSFKSFICYKEPASVKISNKFVTGSMIDFDVQVIDIEHTILSNRVILEVRDSTGKLVKMEYLNVNAEPVQLNYDHLDEAVDYTFTYKAESYNEGYDNRTFKSDYVIYSEIVHTEPGLVGSLQLISLLRQVESKNLFNITDYDRIRKEGNTYYKNYDIENNTLSVGAKNGYVNVSYFVPEAYNRDVVVSFYARYKPGTASKAPVYLSKNFNDTRSYLLGDLTEEYKLYTYSFKSTSNYIGFNIIETANKNLRTDIDIKDWNIVDVTLQGEKALNDVNYSYHSSNYKFIDTVMYAGDEEMPSHNDTGTIVGNAGNGFARITNLYSGLVTTYSYTGSVREITFDQTASYKIELWGASGGDSSGSTKPNNSSRAGYGAYTAGTTTIRSGTKLYLYIGGAGTYSSSAAPAGGYNGGGAGSQVKTGSGGGATDIRTKGGTWNELDSLKSRIMVAAGGGGSDDSGGTKGGSNDGSGGPGGTIKSKGAYLNGVLKPEFSASQVSGYALGQGENAPSSVATGGSGGGLFGGITSNNANGGGSGGSSYISGHLGCVAELDADYTDYVEKAQYAGTINILLQDSNNELVNNDYYVRVYRKGDLVKTFEYDLVNNSANHNDIYQLDKNKEYTLKLCVKVRDRFYDLNLLEFNTSSEIRSINTVAGFTGMHNNGRYIVLSDLEFMGTSKYFAYTFYGELDFQGHTVKTNIQSRSSYLLHTLGAGGTVKNLVLDYYLDNTAAKASHYGFAYVVYGTIDNLVVNVRESNPQANSTFSLVTYTNYGTIKNFVVNSEASVSGKQTTGIVVWSNRGTIKNGYLYGEHMNGYFENIDRTRKDVAPVAGQATTNSRISNVFSLIGVVKDSSLDSEKSVSNMIGYTDAGQVTNVYSVEDSKNPNTNLKTQDPNVGTINGGKFTNMYYSSDNTYTGGQSIKISKLALRDTEFQDKVLNSTEQGFDVESYVPFGYYPQVILNDCMPRQDMIELPSVTDDDLVDVTSSEQLTVNGDSAEVMLTLNNPGAEEIESIGIQDINTVEIISQEDSYGKTKLKIRISNPISYESRYYIREIKVKGASNFTYTREYGEFERSIDVDLYYIIDDLKEWKLINDNPNQNYMLNTDLDFSVEPIDKNIITKDFMGKLNGNGHTIKNIIINNNSYKGFFNSYVTGGTIENLFVENFVKSGASTYSGFIYRPRSGAIIDNVHLKNVEVDGIGRVGGLIAWADAAAAVTIKNSSVTNVTVIVPEDQEIVDVYAGGMVGYLHDGDVFNSFVQNVDIQVKDVLSSAGVGGMIGYHYVGSIKNCYATGKVYNNSVNTGGIVGTYDTITINSVWSNVNLISKLDYLGGIYGKRNNSIIENTFVAGSIYSSYESNNINRTGGNSTATAMNNFAWDRQKFMGFIVGDAKMETFLTKEELADSSTYLERIGYDDNFYYEDISNGSLPKLKHSETGELLANQIDSFLVEDPISVNSDAISIADGVTNSEISITFNNPNNYEIKDIKFDYLKIDNYLSNVTQNGVSVVRFLVSPERSYDSYMLETVTYIVDGKEEVLSLGLKIEKTFYNQINSVDQWNAAARAGTAENYLLIADLDFAGKTITPNAKFGRLESQGVHTIKNVTMTANVGSNFSMIKLLTKTLKDINFENINITSTKTSGSYVSIINLNYADITNVKFIDIVIEAPKISYVAPISRHRGQSMRDIELKGTKTVTTDGTETYSYSIRGNQYVGGLCATASATDTYGIIADSVKVVGSSSLVGGTFGHKEYNNPGNNFNYHVSNSYVSGTGYVGGVFGRGGSSNSSVTNTIVYAKSGSSYVGGFAGYGYQYRTDDVVVDGCTIIADNNDYVGGMFGWCYYAYDVFVKNTTVTQKGAGKSYVGGLIGSCKSYYTYYFGVENTVVTNAGKGTGGAFGILSSRNAYYGYVKDTEVNGVDLVGGLTGDTYRSKIYYCTVNAIVRSTGSNTGGIAGYVTDIDPSSSSYSSLIHDVILANTEIITTGTSVGLLAGHTPNKFVDSQHYKVLLSGNITAPDWAKVGILSANDVEQNAPILKQSFIYDKSTLYRTSGDEVVSSTYFADMGDTYKTIDRSVNVVDLNTLKTATFYTGANTLAFSTSYWATSWTSSDGTAKTVADGYYPDNKYIRNNIVKNKTIADFEVPNETMTYGMNYGSMMIGHELPDVNVYSSGVSTLNIEFDDIDDYSYFEVYADKKLIFKEDIKERTYSITYNYTSDLEVVVSDGTNKDTHYYSAEDLVNKVSTFDNTYAYIYEGKLNGNFEKVKDEFIHIYDNKALTKELNVFSLKTGKFVSVNNTFGVSLLNDTIPLFEFKYDDNVTIDTYATYSVINKDGQEIIYENQIFVKDGVVEIVDSELDNVKNSVIVDEYAKDNYVSVLGNDGSIYDLKTTIKLPSAFTNKNIKYMSNNINSKSSVVVIMYESGKAVVFDYRTGKKIKENKATEDISIVDYFIENMKSGEKLIGSDLTSSYSETLKLQDLLEKTPIVESDKGEYVSSKDADNKNNNTGKNKASNYVTYYDSTKGKYDVVDIGMVIENKEKEVVPETDKIYSSNKLVNFYMSESFLEKMFGNVNVMIIFAIILTGIIGALGLWLRNISKLKES